MITITGWGAFWIGLFGFLAIDVLAGIIKLKIKTKAIHKITETIGKFDPELIKGTKIDLKG